MLEVATLGAIAGVVGVVWGLLVRAMPHADPAGAAGERLTEGSRTRRLVRSRLDPRATTGLALTIAAVAVLATAVVFGVLVAMIRHQNGVVNIDVAVTRWAAAHATDLSLLVIGWVTQAGSTIVVVVAGLATAVYAVLRWRRWSPVVFLVIVVAGQFALSNAVKAAVGRVRPDVHPFHVLSGASFPSGHATAAAATWGAIALVLGRGASVRRRAVLAGVAAGLAAAVACSRVFLGAHWTSDVVGGLFLGWTWFGVCAVAFGGRILRLGAPVEQAEEAEGSEPAAARASQSPAAARDADRQTPAGDVRRPGAA